MTSKPYADAADQEIALRRADVEMLMADLDPDQG